MTKVLVVEEQNEKQSFLPNLLRKSGHIVEKAQSVDSALAVIENFHPEVVLIGPKFKTNEGLDLAAKLEKRPIRPEIVTLMANGRVATIVKYFQLGGHACLPDTIKNEWLLLTIQRAAEKYLLRNEEG